jgi:uncharacterized protein YecT (DUF1311 family)
MIKYLLTLIIFSGFYCIGQTVSSITKIETSYQNCLEKGINKKGCSYKFYKQVDSLLNATYKNLTLKLNAQRIKELKMDQKIWLLKRDIYFKVAYDEVKGKGIEEGTEDFIITFNDKKSQLVIARAIVLLNYD